MIDLFSQGQLSSLQSSFQHDFDTSGFGLGKGQGGGGGMPERGLGKGFGQTCYIHIIYTCIFLYGCIRLNGFPVVNVLSFCSRPPPPNQSEHSLLGWFPCTPFRR